MRSIDAHRALLYARALHAGRNRISQRLAQLPAGMQSGDLNASLNRYEETVGAICDQIILPTVAKALNDELQRKTLEGSTPNQRYQSFFLREGKIADGLDRLTKDYHPIQLHVNRVCMNAADAICEAIQRLGADITEIRRWTGHPCDVVVQFEMTESDPHRDGRRVIIFTFSTSEMIVYKPRSVSIDAVARQFIKRLMPASTLTPIIANVLDRGSYGWCEYLRAGAFTSKPQILRYYRNAGALIAIADIMNFGDGHFENIMASKTGPSIVDCETFFQNCRPDAEKNILFTGMLNVPENRAQIGGSMAGLDSYGSGRTQYTATRILNERTDNLRVGFNRFSLDAPLNAPIFENQIHGLYPYIDDVVEGLSQTYRYVQTARRALLDDNALWHKVNHCRVRQILRPTLVYVTLLRRLEQPDLATSNIKQRAYLREKLTTISTQVKKRLINDEITRLMSGDIPTFHSRPGSTTLESDLGTRYEAFYDTPASEQIRQHISSLDEEYTETQVNLLQRSVTPWSNPISLSQHDLRLLKKVGVA
jgi:type 2 lantibiotic biosynthesis protein LanM